MTTAPYNPCIKPRNAASIFQPLKRKLNDNLSDDTNNQSLNEKDKCSSDQIKKSEKKVYVFPHQHSKLKKKKE